ncbi:MAG: D-glycero-beta-D-manno-heptose 1-phosphate adenylyltransferase [Proteobacteria bacterium]|nr:D-glycero-beta-D-manno-heptose 1-phosphate adenylyltransferase [Pseudomonadota bacterium]
MLDRFVYGKAKRISPEAPIPVLTVEREVAMPGGAGNVARNIASLGGEAVLIGMAGQDRAGDELQALLSQVPGLKAQLVRISSRPTTEKTRYIADRQQIMRADVEDTRPSSDASHRLLKAIDAHLTHADVVVLSDYAKGAVSDAVVSHAIAAARAAGKSVIVDPKSSDLARYDGATVVTPNRDEAASATGIRGDEDEAVSQCVAAILKSVPRLGAAIVTRGSRGMTLGERGTDPVHIRGRAREVFDVSGAGDTVVATLAVALAAGGTLSAAAELANIAAGIAVASVGTSAVSHDGLLSAVHSQRLESAEAKIVSTSEALKWVEGWRLRGERVGFTNGCFDLIHPGHVSLLSQARTHCDRLIVGLNSDASVKRLKGESRPIQDEVARALVLASLSAVDLVMVFSEDTPEGLIQAIRPDALIKGSDYRLDQVVGAEFVASYGGKTVLVSLVPGQSTTETIARLGRSGNR